MLYVHRRFVGTLFTGLAMLRGRGVTKPKLLQLSRQRELCYFILGSGNTRITPVYDLTLSFCAMTIDSIFYQLEL